MNELSIFDDQLVDAADTSDFYIICNTLLFSENNF